MFKVQQRGVKGAVAILQQCLQGVQVPDGAKVHIFDLTANRFAEWSRAIWQSQLYRLKNSGCDKTEFTYTGYFLDAEEAANQQKDMLGRVMEDWDAFCQINVLHH